MHNEKGPIALVIIDGWGYSPRREGNAIALAAKPYYDELTEQYPHTLLEASGTRVGLPGGVMGNSEVGHLNMGAGRVIRMDVSRIDHDIETDEFFNNQVIAKRDRVYLMKFSIQVIMPLRWSLSLLALRALAHPNWLVQGASTAKRKHSHE